MNVDQALATFLAEGRDLVQGMEDALLRLERQPDDADAINAVFRAVHTIKGSGGLFGLDTIVSFTHGVENVLDRVRAGGVAATSSLVATLLACADHIAALLEHVAGFAHAAPGAELVQAGEQLLADLRAQCNISAPPPPVLSCADAVGSDNWHISLRLNPDLLRHGMDPLSLLRYLTTLGDLVRVTTLADAIPPLADIEPQSLYLGLEIELHSGADKAAIEGAFEFVQEGSRIRILPPHCRVGEYIELIHALPEEDRFLGELLVTSGALTRRELEGALQLQQREGEAVPAGEAGAARLGEILVEQRVVQQPVVDAALQKQQQVREVKSKEGSAIRVPAEKLDRLINLVGELVIASASADLLAHQAGKGLLQETTAAIAGLAAEIRESALGLRMVEIGETFHRFHRVVRDVERELGKEIDLVISGADTELDKGVVERIGDPLMHLVRNAIDHGIEPAQARQARGKPARGRLSLNAYHESGSIVIEVADDGGGLHADKIRQRAVERGLITPTQELGEAELHQLIFEPGFSTAEQVTNLSGRGVGMDVVRRNIEALHGSVELESRSGVGTTVRVRLPLTLAIIDGFLVAVGPASYVVPLDMVRECVGLSAELRHAGYLNLRGEVLPLLRLREQFHITGRLARRENVVVIQAGAQKVGLVVDALLGEFQTVIKPLGRLFQQLKGVSGSTILGSGEVALILDVPALVQQAAAQAATRRVEAPALAARAGA